MSAPSLAVGADSARQGDIKFNIIGNKNASIIKELKGIIQPKVKFSVKKLKNTAFEHEEGK